MFFFFYPTGVVINCRTGSTAWTTAKRPDNANSGTRSSGVQFGEVNRPLEPVDVARNDGLFESTVVRLTVSHTVRGRPCPNHQCMSKFPPDPRTASGGIGVKTAGYISRALKQGLLFCPLPSSPSTSADIKLTGPHPTQDDPPSPCGIPANF
jgi:hypothetical protein